MNGIEEYREHLISHRTSILVILVIYDGEQDARFNEQRVQDIQINRLRLVSP
jgi:hypothetical protein